MAGYYCTGKATIPNPRDGTTGNICDFGKYCEIGASGGVDCAIGTYQNLLGAGAPTDCLNCPIGKKCEKAA
jgi:hypothetical protein